MFELVILAAFGALAFRNTVVHEDEFGVISHKFGNRLGKLWDIAHQGMRENRFLRAEKALLTILKIDEKNAAAYNRLGILYAKQREYKDAIDCFEIASSIEASPSSLHNLGLIYYETENYEKAAVAFEQALKLENTLATRHVAYAKVQERLGNDKLMIQELEKAAELEPNRETYSLLLKAFQTRGMVEEEKIIKQKLKSIVETSGRKRRMIRRPRVVI
jgi:tetratricopeptide (TPR) repeat protein